MYVVHNRIDVAPGDGQSFEETFVRNMKTTLAGVPGLRRSALLRPERPGSPYVASMEFASRDDFLNWMKSDSFRAAHASADATGMQAPTNVESFLVVEEAES
jgi:heme-degrading monooxygenase HmoA